MMTLGAMRRSALLLLLASNVAAQHCKVDSKCPEWAPCCSTYGYCGAGPEHCLTFCDPMSSFKPSSCSPMPKCKSQTIYFNNSAEPLVPLINYRGDPAQAAMSLDSGLVEPSKEGLHMKLTQSGIASRGTLLSTTRFFYYGTASAVMKHKSWAGVVNTFIGMSGTKDEIDWEFTTASANQVETNWYWSGETEGYTHGFTVPATVLNSISKNFNVDDWHTYKIDWDANRLQWLIDGKLVRTLNRKDTLNDQDGFYHYPSSPMRLQASIWGAGDGSYPEGVVNWAGGRIDWSKATNGAFTNTIRSLSITCADPPEVKDSQPNYVFSPDQINLQNGQPKVLSTSRSSIISNRRLIGPEGTDCDSS